MAIIYTQTDNTTLFNTGCSGQSSGATPHGREMIDGGTSGITEVSPDPGNNATAAIFSFETTGGVGVSTWDAGDYVVRLNVTTAKGTNIWTETHICERTSGGAMFNTVASLTGQSVDLTTTGVKSMTINRGTDFTPAGTDSDLFIVIVVSNSDNHGNASTGITPDQNIDTPISAGAVVLDPNDVSQPHILEQTDVPITVSGNSLSHSQLLQQSLVPISISGINLSHTQSLEQTILQTILLSPNELSQSHTLDQSTFNFILEGENVFHSHSLEESSLGTILIDLNDLSQSHSLEQGSIVSDDIVLDANDITHSHNLQNGTIDIVVKPEDLSHQHSLDQFLLQTILLDGSNILQPHSLSQGVIPITLNVQNLSHSHLLEQTTFDAIVLDVDNISHGHFLESGSIVGAEPDFSVSVMSRRGISRTILIKF